jgi:hypothetical protein
MKTKTKKDISYVVSRLIGRGIPLVSVFFIYGFFRETEPSTQLTGMSIISLAIVFLLFYKDIKQKVEQMVESQWKTAIDESKGFVTFLTVLLFIQWAKSGLFEIEQLVFIITVSQGLSIYPAALYNKYLHQFIEEEKKAKEKSDD